MRFTSKLLFHKSDSELKPSIRKDSILSLQRWCNGTDCSKILLTCLKLQDLKTGLPLNTQLHVEEKKDANFLLLLVTKDSKRWLLRGFRALKNLNFIKKTKWCGHLPQTQRKKSESGLSKVKVIYTGTNLLKLSLT